MTQKSSAEVPSENMHARLAQLDRAEFGCLDLPGIDVKPLHERRWVADGGPGYRQGLREVMITTTGREALARARAARPDDDPRPAKRRGGRRLSIGSHG